jgi:hypothetical protein
MLIRPLFPHRDRRRRYPPALVRAGPDGPDPARGSRQRDPTAGSRCRHPPGQLAAVGIARCPRRCLSDDAALTGFPTPPAVGGGGRAGGTSRAFPRIRPNRVALPSAPGPTDTRPRRNPDTSAGDLVHHPPSQPIRIGLWPGHVLGKRPSETRFQSESRRTTRDIQAWRSQSDLAHKPGHRADRSARVHKPSAAHHRSPPAPTRGAADLALARPPLPAGLTNKATAGHCPLNRPKARPAIVGNGKHPANRNAPPRDRRRAVGIFRRPTDARKGIRPLLPP